MQVVKKDIDQLNAVLTITIEPADYQENVAKQLKDIRHKANIPGFRPGMVPASLVKKMYGKAVLGDWNQHLYHNGKPEQLLRSTRGRMKNAGGGALPRPCC